MASRFLFSDLNVELEIVFEMQINNFSEKSRLSNCVIDLSKKKSRKILKSQYTIYNLLTYFKGKQTFYALIENHSDRAELSRASIKL